MRRRWRRFGYRRRPLRGAAGAFGLRQNDSFAHDRRLRNPHQRPNPNRRPRCHARAAQPPPGQYGLSILRGFSAHDGARQCRLRAQNRPRPRPRTRPPHRGGARARANGKFRAAHAGSTFGRAAPTGRARARAGQAAAAAFAGRAALGARRQTAPNDAKRTHPPAKNGRRDFRDCHPRPGRGIVDWPTRWR